MKKVLFHLFRVYHCFQMFFAHPDPEDIVTQVDRLALGISMDEANTAGESLLTQMEKVDQFIRRATNFSMTWDITSNAEAT